MRELYAEYRAFAVPRGGPRFQNIEDELGMLGKYSPLYETLEGRVIEDEDLHWLGRKLAVWQVTTAYPVAMQVSMSSIDDEEKGELYHLIYSYIVRRALCGLTGKNLNKVFQSISLVFLKHGPSVDSLERYFADKDGDSTRYPSDDEFRQGILSKPAYMLAPQARIRDILWELEEASRSEFAETTTMPPDLWTEHMLPTAWTKEWPFEQGEFVERWSRERKSEERNTLIQSVGNLTLLTSRLNISAGNKGFLAKREKLKKHTSLFLNRWFLERDLWNESEIRQRGQALADLAVDIWPALEPMKVESVDGANS
ncbi:MAG: HNH endonuclease family protein [Gammaproteobacteria bacterium]|nr:HNH endonuclease family protein [Gammaproteobacteria bacterium]